MLALEGLRVLDLSRVLAGPWCTQTLADLGADVWKIEPPVRGDDTREWASSNLDGESTYFLCCNHSKRSVAVDFRTAEGRALLRDLAQHADVVVENFREGVLAKYGLDCASLRELNERLIYCSISGYGRASPRSGEPGYDFVIQAESGLMSITGEPEGSPMKVGVAITDIVTGMNAVQAILAALLVRERTGRGQYIDLSLLDGAVALLANVGSSFLATGESPQRYGNAHPTVVPYELFNTSDGVLALAVGNDSQFRLLCGSVIGQGELAKDPEFADSSSRANNRGKLVGILRAVFLKRTTEDWLGRLRAAGVPAGKIRSVEEVLTSPEVLARNMVVDVDDAQHGTLRLIASPLAMSETPPRAPLSPPRLGEHTYEVLREVLGLSQSDVDALEAKGAIGLGRDGVDPGRTSTAPNEDAQQRHQG
jgi:crotonobetainyl-CoA:carnitine CoA-transferase CaiB-like acyl-CoA transferase